MVSVQKSEIYDCLDILDGLHDADKSEIENNEQIQTILKQLEEDQEQLRYSNDSRIDMIIKKVIEWSKNTKLNSILENAEIYNQIEDIMPKTNGIIIEMGRPFLDSIQRLSDIASVQFMFDFFTKEIAKNNLGMFFLKYMSFLADCLYNNINEVKEPMYWYLQGCLAMIDKSGIVANSDFLVYFGREICECSIAYIVGHEIGHKYLGHFEKTVSTSKYDIKCDNPKWKLEYEADAFGVDFVLAYIKSSEEDAKNFDFLKDYVNILHDNEYRLLGIPLSFLASTYHKPESVCESDSHPAVSDRLNAVWNYLYKIADIDEINRVKEKYNNTEEIIKNMLKLNQLLDDMEDYPEDTDKPEDQPTSSSGLSAI